MNGSASASSSATMNGTRCAIKAGDEGDITREPIELGNKHRAFRLPRRGQRCGKLGPSIERIGAFAGFDLGELREERDAFALRKSRDCRSLSLQAETRSTLALSGDSIVSDGTFHGQFSEVFKPQTTVCCLLTRT